jgi:hypothetical protein
LLIGAVAGTSTEWNIMESTDDVQNDLSTFSEDDFEAVVQEIRDITDATERRRRVETVPIANSDEQFPVSNPFDDIIDPDSSRRGDVHIIANQISAQDRGIVDEPQSPDHTVLTNAIVEDRLLADYLHSRSQSHHESEITPSKSLLGTRIALFGLSA